MNTLQEALKNLRAKETLPTRSCESGRTPLHSLQVHSWKGESWLFPWAHFASACHHCVGTKEHLALTFAEHLVELEGIRLALLLPGIAGQEFVCLRSLPPKYNAKGSENEPYISRISVCGLADSPERKTDSF
jgi:hypothetical protein